jgi:hypothetical protein
VHIIPTRRHPEISKKLLRHLFAHSPISTTGQASVEEMGCCLSSKQAVNARKDGMFAKMQLSAEPVGSGHYADVYTSSWKNTPYAIKRIKKSSLVEEQDEDSDEMTIEDVLYEAEIMKDMEPHPHIVTCHEFVEDDEHFNFVLDYCAGGELMDAVLEREFFAEREARDTIKQVLLAVAHLHRQGIVHRCVALSLGCRLYYLILAACSCM